MPLNASSCGDDIAAAVGGLSAADKQDLNKVWETIVTHLFNHIKANAQVSVDVPAGLLAAPNGPVTGTTTGTGTIS